MFEMHLSLTLGASIDKYRHKSIQDEQSSSVSGEDFSPDLSLRCALDYLLLLEG